MSFRSEFEQAAASAPVVDDNSSKYKDISPNQLDLLNELLQPGEGILLTSIDKLTVVDDGVKVLYLQRAITQDGETFMQSLDKLYVPEVKHDVKNVEQIELIRNLKKINDICFNNPVSFSYINQSGDKTNSKVLACLDRDFNRLRSRMEFTDTEKALESLAFNQYVKAMVTAHIQCLASGQKERIDQRIAARETIEASLTSNVGWRMLLNIPTSVDARARSAPAAQTSLDAWLRSGPAASPVSFFGRTSAIRTQPRPAASFFNISNAGYPMAAPDHDQPEPVLFDNGSQLIKYAVADQADDSEEYTQAMGYTFVS